MIQDCKSDEQNGDHLDSSRKRPLLGIFLQDKRAVELGTEIITETIQEFHIQETSHLS